MMVIMEMSSYNDEYHHFANAPRKPLMRLTKQKAQENREKIVNTAAHLFKDRGFDGVGLVNLMEQAGFTHGGFYNHFQSKEDLIRQATARSFTENNERYRGVDVLTAIDLYISREHRDSRAGGCPAAALGSDAGRQPDSVRSNFALGIQGMVSTIESDLTLATDSSSKGRVKALSIIAQAVGAIVLSRACPDDAPLADEILDACREQCRLIVDRARAGSDLR